MAFTRIHVCPLLAVEPLCVAVLTPGQRFHHWLCLAARKAGSWLGAMLYYLLWWDGNGEAAATHLRACTHHLVW